LQKIGGGVARLLGGRSNQQIEFNHGIFTICRYLCSTLVPRQAALEQAVREGRQRLHTLERDLRQQERRMSLFLEEVRKRLPGPLAPEQLQQLAEEAGHAQDARYLEFEERFRGSREDIRQRLQVYLPLVAKSLAGARRAVLDLGCGRGEWLELVREQGWQGLGVDCNRAMLEQCRQRGLEVVEGQTLAYLRSLPDASLGVVTAFQLVEHLPPQDLQTLLHETVRVLQPGGLAVFETPNPENLVVGSCDFYRDLGHVRPLHPDTLRVLAEQHGLVRVEVLRLNSHCLGDPPEPLPWHHPLAGYLNPIMAMIQQRLFAAPDFAVVGRKAEA
jgi:O-antigen chain-terminating methyltransferase